MVKRKKSQRGFALATAVIMSAVVLVAGGVLVYQISGGTKDIARDTSVREAVRVAEEGLSNYVNFVYKNNRPTNFTNMTPTEIASVSFILTEAQARTLPGYTAPNVGGGGSKDSGSKDSGSKDGGDKITICHIPPGNPANAQTLEVDASGWNGHDGHPGDTLGACPAPAVDPCADGGSKDSGSKDSGSKDSGSKDSGSKDSGSKDSGSKDSGSKDGGSTTPCAPPPSVNPPASTSGYGVKVVSWREVTSKANSGLIFNTTSGKGQYELETSLLRASVGASNGRDSNALRLRVTSYLPSKAHPKFTKSFDAVLHRSFPAVSAPAPTPTPVATPTPDSGSKDSGSKDSGSKDSGSKDSGSKDS